MVEDTLRGQYAGFISRLIAFGIDIAIVAISLMFLGWLLNSVLVIFNMEDITGAARISKIVWSSAFALLYSAAYFIFFWTLAGQTPGKMLMGLRVVTTDGQALSLVRSVRRFIGYIVSILALWIGFLWILVDNRRQGWHDRIAGTLVIYAWDARSGSNLTNFHQPRQDEMDRSAQEPAAKLP